MATISSTLRVNDQMSKTFSTINKAMNSTLTAMRSIEGVNIGGEFAQAAADVALAERAVEQMNRELQEVPGETKKAGDGFTVMKGLAVQALSYIASTIKNSVGDVIELTDQLTNSAARLSLIVGEGESVAGVQEQIFQAAQRSRGAYTEMLDTVGKLKLLAGDAFSSTEEAVVFAEQLNKQFALAGTDTQAMTGATRQMIQALGSGVLRGDELNSIFEAAPTIIQSIADYMGQPIGAVRELASEGKLTSDVVKNAMFAAADETNAKFSEMPMTIGQIWTAVKNNILTAAQPLLEKIAEGARYIYDNWDKIGPVVAGVAAAIGVVVGALALWTAAQWLLNFALLASPLTWIVLVIALVVGAIVMWIQSVGGLQIAWMIVQDYLQTAWANLQIAFFSLVNIVLTWWSNLQIGFYTGVYYVQDLMANMGLAFARVAVSAAASMGDMKVNVLTILQDMVNGAIGIINDFISTVNKALNVGIKAVSEVTFATKAAADNEARKATENAALAALESEVAKNSAERESSLAKMKQDAAREALRRDSDLDQLNYEARAAQAARQSDIAAKQSAAKSSAAEDAAAATAPPWTDDLSPKLDDLTSGSGSGSALKTTGDVNISGEDIKMLLDLATMDYKVTYQTLTPQLSLNIDTVRENVDVDYVVEEISTMLTEVAESRVVTA